MNLNRLFYTFFHSLLLFIFLGYYSSNSLFYHSHLVNGIILSHSHPYKHFPFNKGPFQSHSHSSTEYTLIQQLNETNWKDVPASVLVPEPTVVFFSYKVAPNSFEIGSSNNSHPQLRAPPGI